MPSTACAVADLFGAGNRATLLGVSFVIHQNYDIAWRIEVSIGIVAGMVQILFGRPSGARPGTTGVGRAG